jgi:hypothetical protein
VGQSCRKTEALLAPGCLRKARAWGGSGFILLLRSSWRSVRVGLPGWLDAVAAALLDLEAELPASNR